MIILKKFENTVLCVSVLLILLLMCFNPEKVNDGAKRGIEISLQIIVPSLFPFMFFICLLVSSVKKLNVLTVYLLSAIGGYPIGTKLANELFKEAKISKKTAEIMPCFCFNAGPGFIVSAIGYGIFGSKKTGAILLFSHLFSSFIIMLVFLIFIKEKSHSTIKANNMPLSEKIISSAKAASLSTLSICGYIIIFSVVAVFLKNTGFFVLLLEISNSVTLTKNIYIISFLLGFGGFCIWMQIFAVSSDFKINIKLFSVSRIIHGAISALMTFISVKVLNINLDTVSTIKKSPVLREKSGLFLSVSLLIMLVVLIIQLRNKIYSGNLKKDIV